MKNLTENLGLKILALILALVIYFSLKNESKTFSPRHDGNPNTQQH